MKNLVLRDLCFVLIIGLAGGVAIETVEASCQNKECEATVCFLGPTGNCYWTGTNPPVPPSVATSDNWCWFGDHPTGGKHLSQVGPDTVQVHPATGCNTTCPNEPRNTDATARDCLKNIIPNPSIWKRSYCDTEQANNC